MYLIVGEQPVSFELTEDGGAILLGWDFKKKEMTIQAADWDDVVGTGGDTVQVTKSRFDAVVRKLKNG